MCTETCLIICPHGFNKCAQKFQIPSTVTTALALRVVCSLVTGAEVSHSEGRYVRNNLSVSKMETCLTITYQGGIGDHRKGSSCPGRELNADHLGKYSAVSPYNKREDKFTPGDRKHRCHFRTHTCHMVRCVTHRLRSQYQVYHPRACLWANRSHPCARHPNRLEEIVERSGVRHSTNVLFFALYGQLPSMGHSIHRVAPPAAAGFLFFVK